MGALTKSLFFQYYDRNIEQFAIAPHLVISLQTLKRQKLLLLTSLLHISYQFYTLIEERDCIEMKERSKEYGEQ